MKKIFTLLFLMALVCVKGWGQVLISPTGDGGFETGVTFAANNWVQVGTSTPTWFVGNAAGIQGGYECCVYWHQFLHLFGSGVTARVNHFYRLAIPAGATNVSLSFYLKQPIIDNTFDYIYIYTTTTANTPVSGTIPSTGYVQRFAKYSNGLPSYTPISAIDLTSLAGTTVRLVFTFKSDGASPYSNPAVDNISLTYTPATSPVLSATTLTAFGSDVQIQLRVLIASHLPEPT